MSNAHELAQRYLAEIDDRYHSDVDAVRDRAVRARDGVMHGAFALREKLEAAAPPPVPEAAYENPLAAQPSYLYEQIPDMPLAPPPTDMYHSDYDPSTDPSAFDTDADGIPIWRDA